MGLALVGDSNEVPRGLVGDLMGTHAGSWEARAADRGLVGGTYSFNGAHREPVRVSRTAAIRWQEKPRFLSGPCLPTFSVKLTLFRAD